MQTVTVAGETLFSIAARMLGEATQWYRIAAANNLTDPMIYGLMDVIIPDPAATSGDGLPES